jgi:hypothetical protein
MRRVSALSAAISSGLFALTATAASAADFEYFNDNPNDLIALRSGGPSGAEAADDFVTTDSVSLQGGTFTGLLAGGSSSLGAISKVIIEIYRVFPLDSTVPASGRVPTRSNSPADVAFASADSSLSELSFSSTILQNSFTALNSVQAGGIHPLPNQQTDGNGPLTGTEVRFSFSFLSPLILDPNHYFFVPSEEFSDGTGFYWLSSGRPISGTGTTPFSPDLQTWVRDNPLEPDWLRVGTDIVDGSPAPTFNASFSLTGLNSAVPEPATWAMMLLGFGLIAAGMRRTQQRCAIQFHSA